MNEALNSKISRRCFLKISGIAAGALALGSGGPIGLRPVTTEEAKRLAAPATETRPTACVMCPAECGLLVNIQDGIISTIYGNPAVPLNAGVACAKGASGMQMVYSPYRIKYPMMRVGERGEGKFKRVSWDEAFDYIAKKLVEIKKKYGPESVIMDCGDVTDRDCYWRLFFAFGTPHCTEHGSICDTPRRHGPKLMFGGKRIEPDIMRPQLVRQPDGSLAWNWTHKNKLIIYAGWNPFTATRIVYESRGTVEAKVAGAKIIVIDPAFSNTAAKADLWLPIRPGTDADLFAAMLRYILENHSDTYADRRYIDWEFKNWSEGWDDFVAAFRSWWDKKDPINGLPYFSLDWAAQRTGLSKEQIAELSHLFGITKPAALVWGMNGIGHHFNGYIGSILGTVLNVITGNLDVPGGAIDTEIVKSSKGGSATGKQFNSREVTRIIEGKEVKGKQEELHMDGFGDWPAAWDDVVGDYPRRFLEGVTLKQGPFRGHKYPIKAYFLRTGNSVATAGATWKWQEALTAKDAQGNYKVELVVYIDTPFLESGLYADVVLPEASGFERISLSDIYPSHPMIYLRDQVIKPLHESKTPWEIMIGLAKALNKAGDPDIKAADFWEKYKTEDDFWTEALAPAPGIRNVGEPLPYPQYPRGYTIIGTPDSLEAGRVKIDHEKKAIIGEPLTPKWLREHQGVAVWPMAWHRYKDPTGGILKTSSKKIEFKWDWTAADGKRYGQYSKYNKLIEESGNVPPYLASIGFNKYPSTFYWFETRWNPYTNPDYVKYKDEYPFQLICGRVHHAMSGTQMIEYLGHITAEGLWLPLNDERTVEGLEIGPAGSQGTGKRMHIPKGTWSIGVIQMNQVDAERLGLKTGDLVELINPLGKSTRGKVNVCQTIRPGVIRIGFGAGGRFSPGLGKTYVYRDVTPDYNMLTDPECLSPIMGQPCYVDMLVKVKKVG